MKSRTLAITALLAASMAQAADDPRETGSREISAAFQRELGQQLTSTLQARGPVDAIAVCRDAAPAIAARLSTESGAQVGRTALRTRNDGNAPDEDARRVLEAFRSRLADGEDAAGVESFRMFEDGSARYLKAIGTQPLCLVCHGENIAPDIAAAIAENYPTDTATGFSVGELRGAFVIDWPAAR
jgi:hypothetical protein